MLKKVYLSIEIGSIVYLVFTSKREGAKDNIIVKCRVEKAIVYENSTIYTAKPIKIVSKAGRKDDLKQWVPSFLFENANIDTGHRGNLNRYPVFTEKEKCIKWLKI